MQVKDLGLTFEVDLQVSREALSSLRRLADVSSDLRAKYIWIQVIGFAMVRAALLRKFLELMPLLHELVLPECVPEYNLLVYLVDLVEPCARTNPRLRNVRFKDGTVEFLW